MISYPRIITSSGSQRIVPIRASINLSLSPLSSAELELKPGDTIPERSMVEMFTESGSAGIFRSKPAQERYGERSTTVSLEHAAAEINDWLTGSVDEQEKAANVAIEAIWESYHGSYWNLGTIQPTSNVIYGTNYNGVLDAIVDIVDQLPDYMLVFNQSGESWTISVQARPTAVSAEGRLSRNIESVEITRDDSELCTRVYIDGYDGHLDDTTAQNRYGIIEHRMSETGYTSTQAARIGQAYLDAHKEPKLSVSINAVDLSQITGESLDSIQLGKRYRLTIPEDEVVIEQTVVGLNYSDVYENPESVQVTLAADPDDVVNYLKKQRKSGGRSSAATNKKFKQFETWRTETDELLGSYAAQFVEDGERITIAETSIEQTASNVTITARASGILLDSNGNPILDEHGNYQYDPNATDTTLIGKLTVNATMIQQEVTRATGAENSLSSRITVEAGKITQIVQEVGANGEVTAASIVAAINDGASSVVISADHIDLQGLVTAEDLYTNTGTLHSIYAQNADINNNCDVGGDLTVYGGASFALNETLTCGNVSCGNLDCDGISFGGRDRVATDMIISASVSGNVLTLTPLVGSPVTFSKATTLNGGWSSGVYTVTAQQNQTDVATDATSLTVTGHWGNASNNESTTTYYGDIKATRNSSATIYDTGKTFEVNASSIAGIDTITKNAESVNPRDYDGWSGTSIGTLAEDTYYQIKATPNAGASAFIKFKTAASSGGQGGIASVTAGGWTWANNTYTNTVTAVANDGTSDTADVGLPAISCQVGTGTSDNATIRPYGPGDHILPTGTSLTLYLKSDNDYVYLTNANANPTSSNTIARASNPAFANGKNAVTLAAASWATTDTSDHNTVSVSTVGRPTALTTSEDVYLTESAWSNGSKTVYLREDSSSGTARAHLAVAIPDPTNYSSAKIGDKVYSVSYTVGGKSFTYSSIDTSGSYNAGWTAAYGKVTLPSAMAVSSNNLVTVKTPPSTVDGTAATTNLYLVCADDYVYIRSVNSTSGGTTYARIANTTQGGIASVALNAHSDDASDWNDWTYSSSASISDRYALIKATPNSGSPYYFGVNASGVYTAGYNAAPVGMKEVIINAQTDDVSVFNSWSASDTFTMRYRYMRIRSTSNNGNNIYTKVSAVNAYNAGYDAAPVGISSISRTGGTNVTSTYNGWSADHTSTVGYKYLHYTATANDGSTRTLKVDVSTTYNNGANSVTISSASRTAQSNDSSTISGTDSSIGSAGYRYFVVTATASNGATRTIGINANPTYSNGWNALVSNATSTAYAQIAGADTHTSNLTKTAASIKGYIWLKNFDGTFVRCRDFTISTGFTKVPETLYTYDPEDGYQRFGTAYIFTG